MKTGKIILRQMDDLKQSVQNASYEQKDPLLIYKFEAFELFKVTIDKVNSEVLSFLFKGELPNQAKIKFLKNERKQDKVKLKQS